MANAQPRPTGVGSKRPRAEVLVPKEREGDGGQLSFSAAYGAPHMSSHPRQQQAAAMGGGPPLSGPHMMQDGSGRGGMVLPFPPHYTAPGLHLMMPDGAIMDHHGVHSHMMPGPPRMGVMPPHSIPAPAGKGRTNGGRPNSPPRQVQLQVGGQPPPLYVPGPPGSDKPRPLPAKLMPGVHMTTPNEYEMLVNGLGSVPMVPGAAQGGPGVPTDGAMMTGKAPSGTLRPMAPPPAQMMNVGQIPPRHGFTSFPGQPVLPGPGPGANATSIALHHQLESQLKQAIVQGQPVQHLKLLIEDHMRQEEKKHKKRAANRRSASSSRARKKKYIEKLTSENRRLKRISRILAILPDLVMVVNDECRITFASWRSQKMLQYDDVLMGKSIFEVALPDCHDRIKAAVQSTLLHSQLLQNDEAEGNGGSPAFPVLELRVKSEGGQEAALVTSSGSSSSSSPSVPGSLYTQQSSMASSTPATSADTRTSGSSAAGPSTATGMPSSGGSTGTSHSNCHHSSGGINSQRQCAQQASLLTGLKDFRNRKNQVCLMRQDGSSMWCTMRASLFLRPVNSRENEDKDDSDNDDDRSVSFSNHEGGGSLAMHSSTQPEVILSFRPVDREMHPVNNKQARQEGETTRRPAVDPKRQHGAASMSGPPSNGKKVASSGSSSGSNGTTTHGGNSTSSSGRSGSSGALPVASEDGGGANRGPPPAEHPNGNGHVLHGSERAPVWKGGGKAKDVAGNGLAATSSTAIGMAPVGNTSSNSSRAPKKAKGEGSVEKGAAQGEKDGGEDHRAIELEAARSLVRIMNSS